MNSNFEAERPMIRLHKRSSTLVNSFKLNSSIKDQEIDFVNNRSSAIVNSIETWIKKGLDLNHCEIGLKKTPYFQYMSGNPYFQNYSQSVKAQNRSISGRVSNNFITQRFGDISIYDSSSIPLNFASLRGNETSKNWRQNYDNKKENEFSSFVKSISDVSNC